MLVVCPECKNNVSDKAKSCPVCGLPLGGYPDFYNFVSSGLGLELECLRDDYCAYLPNDDSCLWNLRTLFTSNQTECDATESQAKAIISAIHARRDQIPHDHHEKERKKLVLFYFYLVEVIKLTKLIQYDLGNYDHYKIKQDPSLRNKAIEGLKSTKLTFERLQSRCASEDDKQFFGKDIEACEELLSNLLKG